MNNLKHLKGKTYYIEGTTNVGLYILNDEKDVVLIDSGFSSNGPIIEKIIIENKFNLKYILTTHVHADHCGANKYLMDKFHCNMITSQIERAFARSDKLDIGFLYGGYPLDEFSTPLMHIDEHVDIMHLSKIPEGIRSFRLPGHHYDMCGFKTSDDVYFVADSVGSIDTINNHHILLIYDVLGYKKSLEYLDTLNGKIVVPSHSEPTKEISKLVDVSRTKMNEIINTILSIVNEPTTLEEIVKKMCDYFNITLSYNKYLLITSTTRSYLAYLGHKGMIITKIQDNKLYYQLKK